MRKFDTKVQYLKYKVLREVARQAWQDTLLENVLDIPKIIVPGKQPTMRCCVYKERAILAERVKLAMGGSAEMRAGAAALSVGIGLQNLPEGAAVSLPLHRAGQSRNKAFAAGVASGLVEPVGGVIAALLAGWVSALMPWMLAGAAGVMVAITLQDLVPDAVKTRWGAAALWLGFVLMMAMDLAL